MSRYQPAGSYSETVLYKGITTSDGAGGGTTLIDSALVGVNDFVTDTIIIIQSGDCRRETRDVSSFTNVTGTITVGTAFSAQIVSGVTFAIVARMSSDVEVAALQADIGDFSARTNDNSLLDVIGLPDVAGKDLYTCLITDRFGSPSATLSTTILDGIDGRTNTQTLNELLGVTDAAGRSINGNIGDFQAQTNLITLLASLGIPDVAGKDLYTCLVTDRFGSPSSTLATTILDGIDARSNNPTLNGMLAIPDNANDNLYRFVLDTVFHDNFDDESLSTTLWGTAVTTGSTTVTESSSAPDTLRIQNGGAGTTGAGTLPTLLTFNRNLSIRTKIELFRGSLAADGERCNASIRLYKDASDYIYFGPYRDTSEAENNRARVVSNVAGAGAVTTDVDTAIEDGIAREYRIDVTEENIYFYIDDIIVHSLKDTTLLNYIIQLYATTQSNTDIIDVRFDYAKVNRISDDYREIYKKLLQIQGGTDSIGTIINALNNTLDLNYIRSSTTADGTEQTIYANTSTRPFIFRNVNIDLSNMAAGDTTVIKKYAMIDGTNYRLIQSTTYSGAQTLTGIIVSGNEGGVTGVKITLTQTAGTNRAYPWTYYDEAA